METQNSMEQMDHFKTSWGSLISPYIQKNVIKRIKAGDNIQTIIDEELDGILDPHSDQYDEAHEIYTRCETLIQNTLNGHNQTA